MNYLEIAKNVFETEISGLNEVKSKLDESFDEVINTIVKSSGRLVITGMGKSGLVGKKISATLASTGTKSFFMHPGEAYHGDLGMIHEGDIILAISNSGETEEIIRLMPFFEDNGNKVIAMTGAKDSTLAKHSQFLLNIAITKEACPLELAPTTSTTVTMAMGDALAVALMEARNFKAENFAKFHPGGSLGRKLLTKVSDVMKKENLPIIESNLSFDEILSVISNGRLGLAVLLEKNVVQGVITDGDIRRFLKEKKADALSMRAKDFPRKKPISIEASAKLVEGEKLMQEKKITALVVTQNEKFVGVLHRYDI